MKPSRILHIVSWYPNRLDPNEGVYVREHVQALAAHCESQVLHLKVVKSGEYGLTDNFRTEKKKISEKESSVLFFVRTRRSALVEFYTFLMLFKQLVLGRKARGFDLINIHIAYPLGVHLGLVKMFVRQPIVFTEHWSAYHFNFYLDPQTPGLERARKVFRRNIPCICVSSSLVNDIETFSGTKQRSAVVPNVVDTSVFTPAAISPASPVFVMVNSWSPVKQPAPVIEAFGEFLKSNPGARLRIGGYSRGNEMEEMKALVKRKGLEEAVVFTGRLSKEQVAAELKGCTALLQPTRYETFSVICAEALCCGKPVAATNTGGIPGFVNSSNGILVKENSAKHWLEAMEAIISKQYTGEQIAAAASAHFSAANVGRAYYEALDELTK